MEFFVYENKKIIMIISAIMLSFLVVLIVVLTVNFKLFSRDDEFDKAETIALLVRDGLTAHMASGTMSQRKLFLDNVKNSSGALDTWIFRTDKVTKLFGKGFKNETIRDEIDKKMISTNKIQKVIQDDIEQPTLRITIPYIATSRSNPDCLSCHTNAKEGDVLGGISMVFDMSHARFESIKTILKIFIVTLAFMIIFIYLIDRFFKPYISALSLIKESLKKADKGDYSSRIDVKGDSRSNEVFIWLNTLFAKLEKTISLIERDISLFVAERGKKFDNPLEKAQSVIEDIANIYKFKRTIEHDVAKEVIYERLIQIFKEELNLSDLSFYEVDVKKDIRILIYDDTPEKFCMDADMDTSKRCRAYRTNSIVMSDDFKNVCKICQTTKEYLCINYPIDENISLILNIKPLNKTELQENKKNIGYIRNYLESARPVLQSKILTEILQRSNMIDGLTGLYNRKYLDIFMDKKIKSYKEYALSMIDIDYFKKVNDTFGHDAGDKVLKGLSDLFKKALKQYDIAFRFGGEEFLIFLPHTDEAQETIEKLKDRFEQTVFDLNGEKLSKTFSAGIAFFGNNEAGPWQVIKNADIAMYKAKNSGRNKIVVYTKELKEVSDASSR